MPPSRNALRRACADASPGCQFSRKPAGPVRPGGLEFPVFELIACEVGYAVQLLRRRQRFWRIAERLHPPPERREHAQAPVLLVADLVRRGQQIAGQAVRDDIDLAKRRGDLIGHGPMRRLRDLVPVHAPGIDLARQRGDDLRCGSLPQHQRRAHASAGSLAGRATTAPATSAPRLRAAERRAPFRRARKCTTADACVLEAAWRAGWSETRRSSRYQTIAGRGAVMRA